MFSPLYEFAYDTPNVTSLQIHKHRKNTVSLQCVHMCCITFDLQVNADSQSSRGFLYGTVNVNHDKNLQMSRELGYNTKIFQKKQTCFKEYFAGKLMFTLIFMKI